MHQLLDLLLPPACAGCGVEGKALCPRCRRHLERRLDEPAGVPIGLPSFSPAGIVQLEWCASFNGPARSAIHALKYDGERRLVGPMADLMAQRWRRAGVGGDALVAVPVHGQRRRERGFDQAELLARDIGCVCGCLLARLAARATERRRSISWGAERGRANVGSAFARQLPLRRRGERPLDRRCRRRQYDRRDARRRALARSTKRAAFAVSALDVCARTLIANHPRHHVPAAAASRGAAATCRRCSCAP